jgi:hypothetical protein
MTKYLILLLLVSGQALARKNSQDIVIKSRLDHQASASLIKRVRTFLINNEFGDPYNRRIESPFLIDVNQVLDDLPPGTQTWIKDLQSLLNLKLFESNYKLQIEDLSYRIDGFNSELMPMTSSMNRIEYVTLNYVQGLKLSAGKISFQVELKRTTNGSPIKFQIDLIEPDFLVSQDLMVELPMGWYTALMPDALLLSLHTIDLSKVFEKVVSRPDLIDFYVKDLYMPQVSVRVGDRNVSFDKEKIFNFVVSRKEEMKMAILDLLRSRMQDRFSNIIKDHPQEIFLPRSFATKGKVSAVFDLRNFNAEASTNVIDAKIDGFFCATRKEINACQSEQDPTKMRRIISTQTYEQSMHEIDLLFMEKRANVAISISEDYINQLITSVAQAGMIDLAGESFTLGPEKAFVLAEEKGEGFSLYLDIIHKLQGAQRVLVGRSELRFPIRLSIGLKVNLIQGIPHLQIKVLEVKTDDKLLIEGLPEYELVTNVDSVRFRKKVINSILEDISPFNQKILVDLELKEFKDTYLEQLSFLSDGKGRANAVLSMKNSKNW